MNDQILATLGAIITFLFGVWQYTKAQKLKHIDNLFIIRKDIEAFMQQPHTKTVHTLTDYVSYKFEKFNFNDSSIPDVFINDEYISYVLRPHSKNGSFHPFEAHLREVFDNYFTELEKYYYYLKIGVFDVDFLRPYLGYYIHIQANVLSDRKKTEHLQALHNYIATYYPNNLCKFYKLFGYTIKYKNLPYTEPERYQEWLEHINDKIETQQEQTLPGTGRELILKA